MQSDAENLRARAGMVPHTRVTIDLAGASRFATNIIYKAQSPEDVWIEEATNKIGDWRSLTRSVYLRWALIINATHLAEERYRALPAGTLFYANTLRVVDRAPAEVRLAEWPAARAADNYALITPLIAAYGAADMYGVLEDIIFDLYEILLRHNPSLIISGPDFRDLRRLWRAREIDAAASEVWRTAWRERFTTWRKNRAYDGLHEVFRALFEHGGLRRPSSYRHTDIPDWCRTIEMIGELRHHVIHGLALVSDKLATLSQHPTAINFDFVAGEQLQIGLHHLQGIECFCDQLLTAINLSLVERGGLHS